MAVDDFLNFYDLFVNEFVGDATIFLAIVLFIVTFALIKSRAPTQVFLMVLFVVVSILSIEFTILRWILALFVGLMAGWLIYARLRRE